eukprot:791539-Alexandrium_andersonii.AAC.1
MCIRDRAVLGTESGRQAPLSARRAPTQKKTGLDTCAMAVPDALCDVAAGLANVLAPQLGLES